MPSMLNVVTFNVYYNHLDKNLILFEVTNIQWCC